MPRIPGTYNGGVQPNLVWDENNPPVKYECCGLPIHAQGCDGTCTPVPMNFCTELEVALFNEQLEWKRIGMTPERIPIDPFKLDMDVESLKRLLVELGHEERMNIIFQERMLNRLQSIRLANETEVKRANLGLKAKNTLLGPNGEPLH